MGRLVVEDRPLIHRHDELGSTNTEALRLLADGAPHGTAVMAHRQTGGRGRLGRVWAGRTGNLFLSVILRPTFDIEHLPLVTLGTGVVLAESLGAPFALKWPNDVLDADGRKLAGVLAEAEWQAGSLLGVVVGIGVNVAHAPEGVPATSLSDHGRVVGLSDLAETLITGLTELDVATVRARWKRVNRTLGRRVEIGGVRGEAVDLDADGALIVRTSNGLQRVTTGDLGFIDA